jgi:hypothetical protein
MSFNGPGIPVKSLSAINKKNKTTKPTKKSKSTMDDLELKLGSKPVSELMVLVYDGSEPGEPMEYLCRAGSSIPNWLARRICVAGTTKFRWLDIENGPEDDTLNEGFLPCHLNDEILDEEGEPMDDDERDDEIERRREEDFNQFKAWIDEIKRPENEFSPPGSVDVLFDLITT